MTHPGRFLPFFVAVAFAAWLPVALGATGPGEGRLAKAEGLLKEGKHREAAAAFRAANEEAGGRCAECLVGLSSALLSSDLNGSIKAAREAIPQTESPALLSRAYHNLGSALYIRSMRHRATGELAEAEQALRKAVSLDHENADPGIRFMLAQLLLESKKNQEAIAVLEELLAVTPSGDIAEHARALLKGARLPANPIVSDVAFATLNGDTIHMQDLTGKVVLLDFWATWCVPCHKSLPGLKTLRHLLRDEPFVVVSISIDRDREALEKYIRRNRMDWPQVWDEKGLLTTSLGVSSFPTYLLIDPKGLVVLKATGWSPDLELKVRAAISNAVKGAGAAR